MAPSKSSPLLSLPQEIPLCEILRVEAALDPGGLPGGANPPCFQVITAHVVYYVGEDGPHQHNPVLAPSGAGREVGRSWEKAVRQAMMPVTPKASGGGAGPGQGRDHSE